MIIFYFFFTFSPLKSPPSSTTPSNTTLNSNNTINQCIQNIPIDGNFVGGDDSNNASHQQKHSSSVLQQQQHLVMNQATTNLSANPIQQQQLLQQQQQQYSTQIRASGYFDTTARGAVHFNRQPSTPSSNEFYNYDSPSPIPTNQMYGVMSNGFHSKASVYRHSAPLSFVMNHSLHQNSNDPNYFAPNNSNARLS